MVLVTDSTKKPSPRRKKWLTLLCVSLSMCTMGVAATLYYVDVAQIFANYKLQITPNSAVMNFMASKMETIYIQAYLFNVTNGDRFLAGLDTKLKVEEVGPFTYKEYRKNDDLELDMESGVMRYSIRSNPVFVPERSIGRPQDFNVIMPNMPMLGVASLVSSYSFFPRMSFNLLSQQIKSKPLVTIDAHSYLWGYEEPILKLANRVLPGFINFNKLGIMERLYNEKMKHVIESSANNSDKFSVRTRNGVDTLLMNEYQSPDACEYCDKFEDTYEGLMFPTPVTPESKVRLFRTGLCKILDMEYNETRRTETYEALVFKIHDMFFSLNKSLVNDGLLDLSDCYFGLPISLTKLYFLDMDPKISERLEGLKKPDPKFTTYIMIDKKMGLTLDTYVPIQINLSLKDLSFNSKARPFSNMILPICYVIIKQSELKQETLATLKKMYYTTPIALCATEILLIALSILLLICSVRIMYSLRDKSKGKTYPVLTAKEKGISLIISQPLLRHTEYR